jgi:hypothetical protein
MMDCGRADEEFFVAAGVPVRGEKLALCSPRIVQASREMQSGQHSSGEKRGEFTCDLGGDFEDAGGDWALVGDLFADDADKPRSGNAASSLRRLPSITRRVVSEVLSFGPGKTKE